MRFFDPSLIVLLVLAALAAVISGAAPVQAQAYRSEATGLQVVVPEGWDGTQAIDETALPGRATYRFEATAPALSGAVLVIERVTGLNPLAEERFRRGQVQFGYHGLRPTAGLPESAMVFGPGAGVALAAGEQTGRVYFVQRGRIYWAVHLSAPASALAERPDLLDALAAGVRLSDTRVAPDGGES